MTSLLKTETEGGIAVLRLNNPPLNLVNLALIDALSRELLRLERDDTVCVLVVTGSGGKAFCAGSDIKEFPELAASNSLLDRKLVLENETFTKLDRFPKPTIAALNGLAFGGGMEIAACCDLVVAEEHVRLALPEIQLGTFPASGGTFRVVRSIGEVRAKQMMLLGEPISAQTALSWGLINHIVPTGESLDHALAIGRRLVTGPKRSLELCKLAIDESFEFGDQECIDRVLQYSEEVFGSPDAIEGVQAFLEKRTPVFRS